MATEAERIKCIAQKWGDSWTMYHGDCVDVVKGLPDDAEAVRWAVLGYAKAVMLKGSQADKSYLIINAFKNNFYDSKLAGLLAAIYEVFYGE